MDTVTPDIPGPGFRFNHRRNLPRHHRKSFTATERLAIAQRIVERMQGRHGGDRRSSVENSTLEGGRVDEIAAQKASLGGKDTYRAAQKVAERGAPELVAAMDAGQVSIHAAKQAVRSARTYP